VLQSVDIGSRSLDAYRGVAPEAQLDGLRDAAKALEGARILHLNATPYGGGVSELLRSSVPLLRALGLQTDWKIISGDTDFFSVTKGIHNALQGGTKQLTERDLAEYREHAERNALLLEESYDFVVVHDPQPVGILKFHGRGQARWVWRCHIDTSEPQPEAWAILREYLEGYDAAVFTMDQFAPPSFPIDRVYVIPPAIDPLSPKNMPIPDSTAREVLDWIGVEADRPLIAQVSRFDPWKDPFGVIDAFHIVQTKVPTAQLALVGSMALDDPEGWEIYGQLRATAQTDPAIHLFTNLSGVGNIEVNAFQRRSDVVVQKSIREGFGLVVSEALWKRTPVVAGRAGGIPMQLPVGAEELLVDSVEECAAEIIHLLEDPVHAGRLAAEGQQRVRESFLLPRLLLDELSLLGALE
jgi:trehalose synthase